MAHRLEVIRDFSWLLKHEEEISELVQKADYENHYFLMPWLKSWEHRQVPPIKPVIFIIRSPRGDLRGMWPFIERKGLLGSTGLWPFVYDEANYFHPICMESAASELVKGLRDCLSQFTFCWIPLVSQQFWRLHLEPNCGTDRLHLARVARKTSLVYNQQGSSFEDYWSSKMGGKSKKSFRYDQKALAKKGEIKIETYATFEEVRAIMPTTCVVEVESWKSKEGAGLYTIRGKRGFFFELLPELAKHGNVRVSILSLDQRPIAWQVELVGMKRVGIHHLAFDQNWKKYSPGKQLLFHRMLEIWKENKILDFLPLNMDYKEKISTKVEDVHELHWFRKSIRGRIARRLIKGNIRLRKKIHQKATRTRANKNLFRVLEDAEES